ncbi:hypothetical protein BUALT_Bualt13G0114600 [Buddleja alternifolia]|uniref:Uncharacterized protein n=1 Tax=Buddleja alternifolia TaxID=168488 RepID=A0AAV6WMD6_9LAMI|nr:hypothetical protein BUALT_Bualt13G0114600 [Buddleja alternifolia]
MSGFARMKRVTDPLDDKAKARIIGQDSFVHDYVSSGSEHGEDDVTSASLSELFFGFDVDDDCCGGDSSPERNESDSDCDSSSIPYDVNRDLIVLQDNQRDAFKNVIRAHISKAVEVFSYAKSNQSVTRRNVMAYLRNCGYNAAVCKAKWRSCGGLTAGSHEFIDLIRSENCDRYLIDLDFAAEFEIARPTSSYERLLQCLPRVFVGNSEDLKRILKVICAAAKRSLKSRGLYLPPWRKHRFMQNKWLGPHRRTVNLFAAATFSSSSTVKVKKSYGGVKCLGFDAAVNGGNLLFPATARTR